MNPPKGVQVLYLKHSKTLYLKPSVSTSFHPFSGQQLKTSLHIHFHPLSPQECLAQGRRSSRLWHQCPVPLPNLLLWRTITPVAEQKTSKKKNALEGHWPSKRILSAASTSLFTSSYRKWSIGGKVGCMVEQVVSMQAWESLQVKGAPLSTYPPNR